MKETDASVEVRPDILDFQHNFEGVIHQLDENAEAEIFIHKSTQASRLREGLNDKEIQLLEESNRLLSEFHQLQLRGRDMTNFGPISSTAAELLFGASKDDLQLPEIYPEGRYLFCWKPKFLTGFITGSNPKNIATWRYEISYEPGSYRHPYISVQWETDWSDWNKFRSQPAQNYPLETMTQETEQQVVEPWTLKEPEMQAIMIMNRFLQYGKLLEIRSLSDAVSVAITGASNSIIDQATGYDPQEVFRSAINQYNQRKSA